MMTTISFFLHILIWVIIFSYVTYEFRKVLSFDIQIHFLEMNLTYAKRGRKKQIKNLRDLLVKY